MIRSLLSLIIVFVSAWPFLSLVESKQYFFSRLWDYLSQPVNCRIFFKWREWLFGLIILVLFILVLFGYVLELNQDQVSLVFILIVFIFALGQRWFDLVKRLKTKIGSRFIFNFIFVSSLNFCFLIIGHDSLLVIFILLISLTQFAFVLISTKIGDWFIGFFGSIKFLSSGRGSDRKRETGD